MTESDTRLQINSLKEFPQESADVIQDFYIDHSDEIHPEVVSKLKEFALAYAVFDSDSDEISREHCTKAVDLFKQYYGELDEQRA